MSWSWFARRQGLAVEVGRDSLAESLGCTGVTLGRLRGRYWGSFSGYFVVMLNLSEQEARDPRGGSTMLVLLLLLLLPRTTVWVGKLQIDW